jgi:hypothetical protein
VPGSPTPAGAYYECNSFWDGAYGEARLHLLDHLIEWYKNRVAESQVSYMKEEHECMVKH